MAKLRVIYDVRMLQYIDWPDDELDNLNYENLHANLDINGSTLFSMDDIHAITKDGEEFEINN